MFESPTKYPHDPIFVKKTLKPFLFLTNPEWVHDVFVNMDEWLGKFAAGRSLIQAVFGYTGPEISKTVDGIRYKAPVILAAGSHYYNGRLARMLDAPSF